MACLGNENVLQQKIRSETTLYHTKEHVIAWVVLAILMISRLILVAQFDEDGTTQSVTMVYGVLLRLLLTEGSLLTWMGCIFLLRWILLNRSIPSHWEYSW